MATRNRAYPVGDFTTAHTTRTGAPVIVRRSTRRTRNIAAFWEAGTAVIAIPARLSAAEETKWVSHMLDRLNAGEDRDERRPTLVGDGLAARALLLSVQYLGARARPRSVRWVSNQHKRWGSATPATGDIRISDAVKPMPDYVLDYVLLHELAHLIVAGHGKDFWALLAGYPQLERARGFLDGAAFAAQRGVAFDGGEDM
ncbi:M48 family metallopeptidase [Specibacter cremeus]|uniref:M48 metallopeptidase family protein n=1 Tax=Specibacter cremeus TaxID=1629051 RepID=UPI000F76D176|nr:M48 family metallopeptidase [Specibacter cremeus]